ncbi:MAG: hypothetical protein COC24_019235 [Alphaproteobacteria bacterium]|nr:hypothetical protein [Alphaproteobacteria bacterium]
MAKTVANVVRGEVKVTVRGEDKVMYLSTGALAALEDKFGAFEKMAESFSTMRFANIVTFLKIVAEVNANDDDCDLVIVSQMRADESPKALMDLMASLPQPDIEDGDGVEKPKTNRKTRRAAVSKKPTV